MNEKEICNIKKLKVNEIWYKEILVKFDMKKNDTKAKFSI